MGHFNVPVTLMNPVEPLRSLQLDMMVDTGATYTVLPPDVVAALGLRISEEREGQLASGEHVMYGVGDLRVGLDGREIFSMFIAGPPGCPALLGVVTLEQFGLGVDPVHERLLPVVFRL
jgi:aspartyl protease family protein